MNRRDFLRISSGAAAGTAATGAAAAASGPSGSKPAQQSGTTTAGNGTTTAGGGGGGGPTRTVELVNYAFNPGTDSELYITPGTTVEFVWQTDTHNIVIDSKPEGSSWEGVQEIKNTGFTHTHTFETLGTYEYHCEPHVNLGMSGTIVVNEQGAPAGGEAVLDPEEMGVPFQAHYVGIATVLMMVVSLIYTFFVLKYGESPHASAPNKD